MTETTEFSGGVSGSRRLVGGLDDVLQFVKDLCVAVPEMRRGLSLNITVNLPPPRQSVVLPDGDALPMPDEGAPPDVWFDGVTGLGVQSGLARPRPDEDLTDGNTETAEG